eukprot:TRINITY_DN2478_c0_g1_i5.p2 TRINITY_DN2478_c0_g1~~TRINITY_DN2478_c0_g1_i5.p2  ORF type:complete len:165 (-),score=5.45 TRINITY_DN2478_c0_g1_i5:342-836(-)
MADSGSVKIGLTFCKNSDGRRKIETIFNNILAYFIHYTFQENRFIHFVAGQQLCKQLAGFLISQQQSQVQAIVLLELYQQIFQVFFLFAQSFSYLCEVTMAFYPQNTQRNCWIMMATLLINLKFILIYQDIILYRIVLNFNISMVDKPKFNPTILYKIMYDKTH